MKKLAGLALLCLVVILGLWTTAIKTHRAGSVSSVAGHDQKAAAGGTAGQLQPAQADQDHSQAGQIQNRGTNPDTGQAQSAQAQSTVVVEITEDFQFKPSPVTVTAGDTVRWVNRARVDHTVTATPQLAKYPADVVLPAHAKPFDSGYIRPGDGFRYTFTVPGKYKYICTVHEAAQMIGEVEVLPQQSR